MTIGGAAAVLVGLGVGGAAMWFAWRVVRAAGREGEPLDGPPLAQPPSQPDAPDHDDAPGDRTAPGTSDQQGVNPRQPSALGQIGAVLALGGVCLWLPSLFNVADSWPLTVAGVIASLLGVAILGVTRRRKRPSSTSEHAASSEDAER